MKVSVQFPMHTRSENDARSLPFAVARVAKTKGVKAANGLAIAIAQRTAKHRREVRTILDSQLPRLRRHIHGDAEFRERLGLEPMPVPNFFRVTLIRISAGELDTDGLAGALKAVRDEVAAWLGIDDSARSPASWRYGQQRGPRGVRAVRIEIEDDDPTTAEQIGRPSGVVIGGTIAKLGPVVGDVHHAERGAIAAMRAIVPLHQRVLTAPDLNAPEMSDVEWARAALAGKLPPPAGRMAQAPLVFRRSYYAPPGQDEDADEVTLEELTGPLFEAQEPPPLIIKGGRVLLRRQDFHPALGEHWIYEAAPSAARPSQREERAEARR